MIKNIIVRADFCPNGEIIPISITFIHKNTMPDSIMISKSHIIKTKDNYKKFCCNAAGKDFILSFNNNHWTYEDMNEMKNNHKDHRTNRYSTPEQKRRQTHNEHKSYRK